MQLFLERNEFVGVLRERREVYRTKALLTPFETVECLRNQAVSLSDTERRVIDNEREKQV